MSCKNGNHIIGCGYDKGAVTLDSYVEDERQHPGKFFRFCPECAERIYIESMADEYEAKLAEEDRPMGDLRKALGELNALIGDDIANHIKEKQMTDQLRKCPFCGVNPYIAMIGRDWYRLTAHHDENCILHLHEEDAPQTEEQKQLLIEAWNTRHIPEGYALVPVEPTEEMKAAFNDAHSKKFNQFIASNDPCFENFDGFPSGYKAMIKAAQENSDA